jgi:hypothetical protein
MILSRSLPLAGRAGLGSTGLVRRPPFRIGVGVDGSPSGGDAVVLASQLAAGTSAERMLTGCRRGG